MTDRPKLSLVGKGSPDEVVAESALVKAAEQILERVKSGEIVGLYAIMDDGTPEPEVSMVGDSLRLALLANLMAPTMACYAIEADE